MGSEMIMSTISGKSICSGTLQGVAHRHNLGIHTHTHTHTHMHTSSIFLDITLMIDSILLDCTSCLQ